MPDDTIVTFLRKRDYALVRELGEGACGKTILLHDDIIDKYFVCKKYAPNDETDRAELFSNFLREIKLLHELHHRNLVRVFNYYLYPEKLSGFILMEFIEGDEIDDFLTFAPEQINEIFLQTLDGFSYLESKGILHRDIRPSNLMVQGDGTVKIIDLGFGKKVAGPKDFAKSVSLNWWCTPPLEFEHSLYDFRTEVYFVGKLFEQIIIDKNIEQFKYNSILVRMCRRDPVDRISSFTEILKEINNDQFITIDFTELEQKQYREFSSQIRSQIIKIENGAKYIDDLDRLVINLDSAFRGCRLEAAVPDAAQILRCFVNGGFSYRLQGFPTSTLRDFIQLMKGCGKEKQRVILANLHTTLDAVERYSKPILDEDIPF